MANKLITHLRHVDIAVPDFTEQVDFYTGLWGLKAVDGDASTTFLAAEGSPEQYAVRVRRDADKRLDLIAFGSPDRAGVDTLAGRLASGGVKLVNEPGDLQTPGGGYGFRFFDHEGRTIEVSCDVAQRTPRAIEEGESIPVRLQHVVVNSAEPEALIEFYVRHLGFELSDTLYRDDLGEMMWFLRCSTQHHSLAIARCPHVALHHASFEMRGIDEYLRGTGRMLRNGIELVWGPGKHLPGGGTYAYFLDPNGNNMEYTTAFPDSVAESIAAGTYPSGRWDMALPETSDVWGISPNMNAEIARKQFNDPDKGLFTAPPV